MRTLPLRLRRRIAALSIWSAAIAAAGGVFLAYRWAEPTPAALNAAHSLGGGSATVRLVDTPLAGYVDGARSWSIHAGTVDLLRLPNASLSNIQSANVVDIRDGTLYEPPRSLAASQRTTRVMEAGASPVNSSLISATFHANTGRYSTGMLEAAPADIEMLYTVQWQFKLAGDVVFRTRSKDEISAPSMTIYHLVNRRTGRSEQRVMCEEGGKMTHKGIQVTANSIRYSPKDRTVDCLSGVRGTFKQGNVQTERVYWALDDEILRCPESASGTIQGTPFIGRGITLDIKHGRHHADYVQFRLDQGALSRSEE